MPKRSVKDSGTGVLTESEAMIAPTMSDAAVAWEPRFVPRRFLRNGHLQTLAGNFLPRKQTLPEPESLLVEVEGPVAGYGPTQVLCHCHWQPEDVRRVRLTVVLIHGLEGSSNSQYVVGNTARALAAGCNVVRMNMRSCGGADHLSPTIYHSGRSGDVARVLERIVDEHALEQVALVGYSMGGNMALKLLGEYGVAPPPQLKAVVGISPLMDLTPSSAALHEPANRIYEWHFVRALRRRLRYKSQLFPRLYPAELAGQLRTMRDFDNHAVARYGGFRDADDYYVSVASSQYAAEFRVPTLILHSLDDPFIRMLPTTRAALLANRWVSYVETQHGGHCAFLSPADRKQPQPDFAHDGYWAEHLLLRYLLEQARGS
ncbi:MULTISPECIES: alpha/beta fold hydrolase [Acidobacterium]|nr:MULTISPECIES: alpha/beta fold hydrolase [Acidobacterium]